MMYYLLLILLYPLSLLPLPVLYFFSDCCRWLLFGLIGYRKEVIRSNISHAFPDYSDADIEQTVRRFQEAFCDQWIEVLKLLSISKSELNKRVSCDWSLFRYYHEHNIRCHALLGHQFNWEWANAACQLNIEQVFAGMYLPQNNKGIDRFMNRIRSRFGSVLISAKNFKDALASLSGKNHILGLIADQKPGSSKSVRWYNFFHRPAPFMTGPEKAARLSDVAVAFAACHKVKRGYYRISLREICRHAKEEAPYSITDTYIRLLEESIRSQPYNWLWSHKRWKKIPAEHTLIHNISQTIP